VRGTPFLASINHRSNKNPLKNPSFLAEGQGEGEGEGEGEAVKTTQATSGRKSEAKMSFLFGEKKKDPKEVMRESQKALKKTEREMERERNTMKRQEEAILKDIKKAAKVRASDVSTPLLACHSRRCAVWA
jgi:hypothetical protein